MSNLTDNVTLLNISKAVTNTGDNFIPKGTVFTLNADGSGDFATLSDAVDYLDGKYSNGEVIFELGEGTFNVTKSLTISALNCNIPRVTIRGKGIDVTIIKVTSNINILMSVLDGATVNIIDVTLDGDNKVSGDILYSATYSVLGTTNVKFINSPYAVWIGWDSNGTLAGKFYVENCTQAVECQNHAFLTLSCCDVQFKNVNLGFSWFRVSTISIIASTYTFTNVSRRACDSINVWGVRGICQADNTF